MIKTIIRYYLKFEPQPRSYLRLIGSTELNQEKSQQILNIAVNHNDNDKGGYVELSCWKIVQPNGLEIYRTGVLDNIHIPEGSTRQKAIRRFPITETAANKIKKLILKEDLNNGKE